MTYRKNKYKTPEIESYSIRAEVGFIGSDPQLPEYEEDDNVIVID